MNILYVTSCITSFLVTIGWRFYSDHKKEKKAAAYDMREQIARIARVIKFPTDKPKDKTVKHTIKKP